MYSGGWCGRSLPRHTHRDLVCTAEAGVAGHFLDTRGSCVYSGGWRGRQWPAAGGVSLKRDADDSSQDFWPTEGST